VERMSEQIGAPVTSKVLFGGDYNPEQWPEDV
jgi:beta-galactosidase GanA